MAQSVQVQKVNWWHERLADYMIAYPDHTLGQIAQALGKSQSWISIVKNSDCFIDYWQRRSRQHSEAVTTDVKAKAFSAADIAADLLNDKLTGPEAALLTTSSLLEVIDVTMKRFGYDNGAKAPPPVFNFNLGSATPEQLAAARQRLRGQEIEVEALPAPKESGSD